VTSQSLFAMVPKDEANYVTHYELQVITIYVPVIRLERAVQHLLGRSMEDVLPQTRVYKTHPQRVLQLRDTIETVCETLTQLGESTTAQGAESELEDRLMVAICGALGDAERIRLPRIGWKHRNKYARQARDFIESHLGESISPSAGSCSLP
jgi:hypothetical protein